MFTVLLDTLTQQPDFLTPKTRQQAAFFILARCKISSLRAAQRRCCSLDTLLPVDWNSTLDEHALTGLEARRTERRAAWATQVDMYIDIERVLHKLADKYADSPAHLVALYHVTTQVSCADAARITGITPWNWYKGYVVPVLQEVQYEIAQVLLEQHA